MNYVKQLSLFVENRPGSLSQVCRILHENGIDISTLSLADTQQFGILRLLIKDYENAKRVLEQAGFIVKITDVLALTVPDRPGGLAEVLALLDKHKLAVEYMYAFSRDKRGEAVIVFRLDESQGDVNALNGENLTVLGQETLFA